MSNAQDMPTAATPLLPLQAPQTEAVASPAAVLPEFATKASLPREKRGYVFMIMSAVCFAATSVLARVAQASYDMPSSGALQTRATLQVLLTIVIFPTLMPQVTVAHLRLSREVWLLLVARGIVGALVIQFAFTGLRLMPAGDAAAILFTVPLFALAFGALVLAEPVTWTVGVAALLSLTGVTLVASPWTMLAESGKADVTSIDRTLGSVAMMSAACLSGVAVTLVRLIGDRVHCLASVLSQGVFSMLLGIALGGMQAVAQAERNAFIAMLASSACAFVGQIAMDRGMQLSRVGAGMLVGNVEVPLTYLAAVVGLGETPGWVQIFGACLVVMAGVVLGKQKK